MEKREKKVKHKREKIKAEGIHGNPVTTEFTLWCWKSSGVGSELTRLTPEFVRVGRKRIRKTNIKETKLVSASDQLAVHKSDNPRLVSPSLSGLY